MTQRISRRARWNNSSNIICGMAHACGSDRSELYAMRGRRVGAGTAELWAEQARDRDLGATMELDNLSNSMRS